uniref:TIR domain-containing protein n=1 Tax=Strongyloides venezuelensis TaxID=75913 RepID=A0A0K0F0C0_STRVS
MKIVNSIVITHILCLFLPISTSIEFSGWFECGVGCRCSDRGSNGLTTHHIESHLIRSFPNKYNASTMEITCRNHKSTDQSYSVDVGMFEGFRILNFLSITNCWLGNLPPTYFSYLPTLTTLRLEHAKINDIHPMLFNSMPNLMVLSLAYNNLQTIPMAINSTKSLINLTLSNNTIYFLPDFLLNLRMLQYLYIENNDLVEVRTSSLPNSTISLFLRGNKIKIFDHHLSNLPKLDTLDLGENDIDYIGSKWKTTNCFPITIRKLYLDHNKIYKIEDENSLKDMKRLSYIKLKQIIIKKRLILHDRTIISITLANNPLKCHCENEWIVSQHNNTNNNIVIGDLGSVTCLDMLVPQKIHGIINASNENNILCPYDHICIEGCECCMSQKVCNCSLNCLPDCNCFYSRKIINLTPLSNKIKCTELRKDKISLLPKGATELHLLKDGHRSSGLMTIPGMENLKVLNMSGGNILSLETVDLRRFPKLEILDLSYNAIDSLEDTNYDNLGNIKHLNLKGNFLKEINNNFLQYVSRKLEKVWLSGNGTRYSCDCDDNYKTNYQKWLDSYSNNKKVEDLELMRCRSGVSKYDLNMTQFLLSYPNVCLKEKTTTIMMINKYESSSKSTILFNVTGNIKREKDSKIEVWKNDNEGNHDFSKYDVPLVTEYPLSRKPIFPDLSDNNMINIAHSINMNQLMGSIIAFTVLVLVNVIFYMFIQYTIIKLSNRGHNPEFNQGPNAEMIPLREVP